ncbi:uncharacterized protein LOC129765274 [Toxorhynchites rutilus septentrionalis]|uniref:uncharacterized protein LOC129765274 n=1 Tax=Toxorhynchites rutilus septentrionalis TaxID=329112 RepID=UPI0024788B2C|nr:uncharacterized protein LOC129765274 [Toxorhynchites rutilus septentrionalis]
MCGYTNGENLMRLQRYLRGNALEAVRSHLMHPSSVPLIIDTLKILFGRPEMIVNSLLRKVRSTPPPKIDKLETLINFGLACQNLCEHLRAAEQHAHLANPILLKELVDKLPTSIKLDWSFYKRQFSAVDLDTFGKFMSNLISAASDVVYTEPPNDSAKQNQKEKLYLNTHASSTSDVKTAQKMSVPKPCCICQIDGHKIRDCRVFFEMNLNDCWKIVQERFLCRRCLNSHGKFPCKASYVCGVENCIQRHHKLLHPGKPQLFPQVSMPSTTTGTVSLHRNIQPSTFFRIIPIILYANGKSLYTFAFLDEGSSTTIMEARIAEKLGLDGENRPLCLRWTNDIERTEEYSQIVNLNISGCDMNATQYRLNRVYTVNNLRLPNQTLNFEQLCDQFPYLRGLPVRSYKNAVPSILIVSIILI